MTEVVYGRKMFAAVAGKSGAIINDPKYEVLVRAIVLTAVKDYKVQLRKPNQPIVVPYPNWPQVYIDDYIQFKRDKQKRRKKEVESFFESKWFTELTGMDGKRLMQKIQKEIEDEQQSDG